MYQTLVEYSGLHVGYSGERKHGRKASLVPQFRRMAVVACGIAATSTSAVDANVEISEGRNPLVPTYMARQAEKLASAAVAGNNVAVIERASALTGAPFFTASDSARCRDKAYRFCRDLGQ